MNQYCILNSCQAVLPQCLYILSLLPKAYKSISHEKKGTFPKKKRGQATFSDVGIRSYLRECCKDEKQESIFSLWQGLTPIIEAVLFLTEKVACPLFFPFFT